MTFYGFLDLLLHLNELSSKLQGFGKTVDVVFDNMQVPGYYATLLVVLGLDS
jgi:hypothetical protein